MGEDARNLSTYPPPPPFYRLYTSAPEDEVDADTRTELDIYTPPPTLTDSFIKFGAIQSNDFLVHSLGLDVPKLYSESTFDDGSVRINYSLELRKLVRRVADEYVEILDALTESPQNIKTLIETLSHTFTNMTHLLNLMRSHQATQTLVSLLRSQISNTKEATRKLQTGIESAQELLAARGITFNSVDEPVCMEVDDRSGEAAVNTNGSGDVSAPGVLAEPGVAVRQAGGSPPDERLQLASQLREEIEALSV